MLNTIQRPRMVPVIHPAAIVDNAYFAGSHQHGSVKTNIDTRGYWYAMVWVYLGATDIEVAEMSLYDSNTTTDNDFTIITASNYATAATLPSATDDNKIFGWGVDLRIRKRYLRVNLKGGDGTTGAYAAAWAALYRAEETPNTTAEMNVGNIVYL